MSIVMMVLYNPLVPARPTRVFLLCMMSRITIMRVRRTLREIETEKYGTLKRTVVIYQVLLSS